MTITVESTNPSAAGSINENDAARAICRALGRERGVTVSPGHIHVLTETGWIVRNTPPEVRHFLVDQLLRRPVAPLTFDIDLRDAPSRSREQHQRQLSVATTIRVVAILSAIIGFITFVS